jgi:hypothetical protein
MVWTTIKAVYGYVYDISHIQKHECGVITNRQIYDHFNKIKINCIPDELKTIIDNNL